MTHTYFAPLLAFDYEGDCMRLAPGLVIDELSDIERDLADHQGVRVPLAEHCVRLTTAGVGPSPEWLKASGKEPDPDRPELAEACQRIRNVACALRLFQAGQFDATYIVLFKDDGESKGVMFESQPLDWPHGYKLDRRDGVAFAGFWKESEAAFDSPWMRPALRRFDFATSRHSQDDKLVDLAISAESLFLRGAEGEFRYKLALRCAYLLGSSEAERRRIFDVVRKAYDVRSWIVHGVLDAKRKDIEGTVAHALGLKGEESHVVLGRLAEDFEEIVRQSLRRAMREMSDGAPDWDRRVLRGGD